MRAKFRIPDTELYLDSDGLFSPIVEPGEPVFELTSEHAQVLKAVYHGQALQHMTVQKSSGGGHIGGDETSNYVLELLKLVPYFHAGLEATRIINEWAGGAHGKPDPIMESLNRVHQTLGQIQDFNLAAWVSSREDNLAFLLAHSSTAFQTANAFVQSKASRNDPVWAAKIAIAERDSLLAVQTFAGDTDRGYWQRPESLAALSLTGNPTDFYRGWMPHIPDRAEVRPYKLVWDYRWALPALNYAIAVRLLVLEAFKTGTTVERQLHCAEIKQYVSILQSVFAKRWSGLRTLNRLSDLQRQHFQTMGRFPLVAVDLYGGYFLGGIYYASAMRHDRFAPGLAPHDMAEYGSMPIDFNWVEHNVRAFARHWWNLLYLETGLEQLLLIISELQAICDAPWFAQNFVEVHDKVRRAKSQYKFRTSAAIAASLSSMVGNDDSAGSKATRTHVLYEALTVQEDDARAILEKCIRDLSQLSE